MALGGFWVRAVVDQLRSVEKREGWDRERFVRFFVLVGRGFFGWVEEAVSKSWLFSDLIVELEIDDGRAAMTNFFCEHGWLRLSLLNCGQNFEVHNHVEWVSRNRMNRTQLPSSAKYVPL